MKTCHWVWQNGSGMARVAESMAEAERALGIDAILVNVMGAPETWDAALDADVQILHTHIPDTVTRRMKPGRKLVYVVHGQPEVVFFDAMDENHRGGPWAADGWQLMQHWLAEADATVTFWPRHQWIYRGLSQKRTRIDCVPLGVDKTFWKPGHSAGKLAGKPSVFTCENAHRIKSPWDIFLAWPEVWRNVDAEAKLHAFYLPNNQHRFFFPLVNQNGASYAGYIGHHTFSHEQLRSNFCSTDFYVGLVSKGDFNRVCLEANACGTSTISYRGNPYSDFWVPEGDQREVAAELIRIIRGEVAPRDKAPVPEISETASAMKAIYETL